MRLQKPAWVRSLAILVALPATLGSGQEPNPAREQVGEVAATTVKGYVRSAWGAEVEWGHPPLLILPSGEQLELLLPGFLQSPRPDGFLAAMCVVWSKPDGDGPEGVRVAAMETDREGHIRRSVTAPLDEGLRSPRCMEVALLGGARDAWPMLRVRYESRHTEDSGSVAILWTARLRLDPYLLAERRPTMMTRFGADGQGRPSELIVSERVDAGRLRLRGRLSGESIVVPCPEEECVVDFRAVLAAPW